jgi:hypothetical protein
MSRVVSGTKQKNSTSLFRKGDLKINSIYTAVLLIILVKRRCLQEIFEMPLLPGDKA